MTVVANILVALAVLVTVLLFLAKADLSRLSGPDRSGADIILLLLMAVRWLLMAAVLSWCVWAGRFDWIGGGPGARWLAVLGTHAGLGFLSAVAMVLTVSRISGMSIGSYGMIGWAGMPALVMLVTLAAIDGRVLDPEGRVRWLLYGLAGLGAAGCISGATLWIVTSVQTSRQRAASRAEMQAESDAQQAAWNAKQAAEDVELEKMDTGLSLDDWIVHTHIQYSEKHQKRAAELIAQRPRLVEELTEMLAREDPMQREYANSLIRELPTRPKELIGPLIGAQKMLAAQLRDTLEGRGEPPSHPIGMPRSTLKTAGAMGDPAEMRPGLIELQGLIERMNDSEEKGELLEQYRRFLSAEVGHGRAE